MQVNLFPSVLYCSSKKHPSGIEWLTCRQIKRQGLKFGLIFDPEVPLEVKNTSVIEWLTQVKRQVLEFGLIFDQETHGPRNFLSGGHFFGFVCSFFKKTGLTWIFLDLITLD